MSLQLGRGGGRRASTNGEAGGSCGAALLLRWRASRRAVSLPPRVVAGPRRAQGRVRGELARCYRRTTGGGATLDPIRAVLSRSRCRHCVVVTAVAHRVHLLADTTFSSSITSSSTSSITSSTEPDDSPVFRQLEEKLREWMGDVSSTTAEVMHAPLTFALVSQQRQLPLLLAPAFAQLFPLLPRDLDAINATRPEEKKTKKKRFAGVADVDLPSLPAELQMQVRCLASALNALFEGTATREESFAAGPMSRLIAGELASHPQAKRRRKTAPNKASIIFIDRTMDLTGAVGHHGDNLVEKILTVLEPLPGHVTDVQVNMSELTGVRGDSQLSQGTVAPGCLAQDPPYEHCVGRGRPQLCPRLYPRSRLSHLGVGLMHVGSPPRDQRGWPRCPGRRPASLAWGPGVGGGWGWGVVVLVLLLLLLLVPGQVQAGRQPTTLGTKKTVQTHHPPPSPSPPAHRCLTKWPMERIM
ncbi:hypothetical protein CRUP_017825, partial [Coryphaenoides rupestris]